MTDEMWFVMVVPAPAHFPVVVLGVMAARLRFRRLAELS